MNSGLMFSTSTTTVFQNCIYKTKAFSKTKSDSTKQIAFKAKSNSKMRKSNLVYGVQIALIQGLDVCKQIYTASQVGNEP